MNQSPSDVGAAHAKPIAPAAPSRNPLGSLWRFISAPAPHETAPGAHGRHAPVASEADAARARDNGWLHELLLPLRPAYRQAITLAFLINLIALGAAVYSLQVYDRVIGHAGYSSLIALSVGMLIAVGFD